MPDPSTGQCGLSNSDRVYGDNHNSTINIRIYGGQEADLGEFPWMALIQFTWRKYIFPIKELKFDLKKYYVLKIQDKKVLVVGDL